jgi:hypothetical protein
LKNIKTDLVLLEFPYLYHIARIISKNNNSCPIYLLEHNIEWKYLKGENSKIWRFVKIFEEYVIKNVTKVLAISLNEYEYIKNSKLNDNVILLEH